MTGDEAGAPRPGLWPAVCVVVLGVAVTWAAVAWTPWLAAVVALGIVVLAGWRSGRSLATAPFIPALALGAVAAVVLAGVVPAVVLANTGTSRGPWVLALAVASGTGLWLARLMSRDTARPHEFMLALFTYVFLGLAPLAQIRDRVSPITTPDVDRTLDTATLWAVIVGCAALGVGLWLGARRVSPDRTTTGRVLRAAQWRTLALTVAALTISAFYVTSLGVATLFSSRAQLDATAMAVWPDAVIRSIISGLTAMTLLVAAIANLRLRAQRKRDLVSHVLATVGVAVTIGSLLLVVNPITSPRYVVGTVYLSLVAALGGFSTVRRFRIVAVLSLLALIVVFPAADAFRYSASAEVKSHSPVEALKSADFDAYSQINNTLLYVERHGVTEGRQALGVLLFWVPRSIWPDKPVDTGILLAEDRDYPVTNLSAPLWSELYINGGWTLLVVGMAAAGWFVRGRDLNGPWLRPGAGASPAAYVLPAYLVMVLRGSLLQAMAYLGVILLASWFVRPRAETVAVVAERELHR
jgi:hypothetical protein